MHCIPEGSKEPRSKAVKKLEEPRPLSRWIVEDAIECGLSTEGSVVRWSEIHSWMNATGRSGSWIAMVVRGLSVAYIDQYKKSVVPSCPMPIIDASELSEISEIRRNVLEQFKNFVSSKR